MFGKAFPDNAWQVIRVAPWDQPVAPNPWPDNRLFLSSTLLEHRTRA